MMYVLYDGKGVVYKQGKSVLTKKASGKHEYLEANFYIEKAGRMEAFLVNETETDVWFDDFRVESRGALVVQEDHYDPWGLQLSGLEYRAGGMEENRYLYNGKEKIGDSGLDLYDFGARLYDPAIGRWMTVDPLADHPNQIGMSPYSAMWNNPIRFNDPTGLCPDCPDPSKAKEGDLVNPNGGMEFIFTNGEWTGVGRTLEEFTVTGSRLENGDISDFDNENFTLTAGGAIYGLLEGTSASQGFWLGENGEYYSQRWGGNQYTGSRAGAIRAAKAYKLAGRATIIGSAGIGIYSTIEGYQLDGAQFGYGAQRAAVGSTGSILGGMAGAKAGVLLGGAVGAWVGGVGAIPGAVIGGVIGGFGLGVGGSYLGGLVGESTVDYIHKP
jgi:RHS repeat-associated protein